MLARLLFACLLVLPLAACLSNGTSEMIVPHPAIDRPATVDPAAALALVNAFRAGNGLPPVALDPKLTAIAAKHARAMAAADNLSHVLPGEVSFSARLTAGGFDAGVAAENIGAGYHDLDEAFSGWRASPPHRVNMLNRNVTLMGIAVAYSPSSRFKDFWSLVLAAPNRHLSGGPPAVLH